MNKQLLALLRSAGTVRIGGKFVGRKVRPRMKPPEPQVIETSTWVPPAPQRLENSRVVVCDERWILP